MELREEPYKWSYRRIARVLGVSHPTVMQWLGELEEAGGNFLPPETGNTIIGADGKQYPATKPKKINPKTLQGFLPS